MESWQSELLARGMHPAQLSPISIASVMIAISGVLVVFLWQRHDLLANLFATGLLVSHVLLLRFAVRQFPRSVKAKPLWRLLARGFVDSLVYYGFLFFIASVGTLHLRGH